MRGWLIRFINGDEVIASAYWANGEKFTYLPHGSRTWKTIGSGQVEYIDVAKPFSESEEQGKLLEFKLPRAR